MATLQSDMNRAPGDRAGYAPALSGSRQQDWINVVLAIWLFISPWVLGFGPFGLATAPAGAPAAGAVVAGGALMTAAWNAWVLGAIVFLVSMSAVARRSIWQEWATLLLGIWVFIAPWALAFTRFGTASWDHWVVGFLIFVVSVANLSALQRAWGRNPAM